MILAAALLALAAPAAAPAAQAATPASEAMELAREIASHGMLATIAPLQTRSEIEEMVAENPDLTPDEQAQLRAIGKENADAIMRQAIEAEAKALVDTLSIEDLRVMAAYERSETAQHRREAMPRIMAETMQTLGEVDFGGSVRSAFCKRTGKLCD